MRDLALCLYDHAGECSIKMCIARLADLADVARRIGRYDDQRALLLALDLIQTIKPALEHGWKTRYFEKKKEENG